MQVALSALVASVAPVLGGVGGHSWGMPEEGQDRLPTAVPIATRQLRMGL